MCRNSQQSASTIFTSKFLQCWRYAGKVATGSGSLLAVAITARQIAS